MLRTTKGRSWDQKRNWTCHERKPSERFLVIGFWVGGAVPSHAQKSYTYLCIEEPKCTKNDFFFLISAVEKRFHFPDTVFKRKRTCPPFLWNHFAQGFHLVHGLTAPHAADQKFLSMQKLPWRGASGTNTDVWHHHQWENPNNFIHLRGTEGRH